MSVRYDENAKTWTVEFYYKDIQGNRKHSKRRGFKLKKDAQKAEQELIAQYSNQNDMLFSAMYEIYMSDFKARNKKPTTLRTKTVHFEQAILPYFSNLKLSEITPAHVRDWQNQMIAKYAPTTQKQLHGQLSALFNFAVKFYDLPKNPAQIAGSIGQIKADSADFWTVDEFNAAMRYARYPDKVAFYLFFYAGLRRGELLALNIEDYDPIAKTINITKSYERVGGIDYITDPKNPQSNRKITIPSSVANMLDEYIKTLYDPAPNSTLWPTITGHRLRYQLERAAQLAGVKKIRLHDLRHSHASLLIQLDVNLLAISKRLGHKDIQTTLNIYGHLYKEHAEQIANILQEKCFA